MRGARTNVSGVRNLDPWAMWAKFGRLTRSTRRHCLRLLGLLEYPLHEALGLRIGRQNRESSGRQGNLYDGGHRRSGYLADP